METEEASIQPILFASGILTAKQTITGTVEVDWSGQAAFYLTWIGGDLSLTLRDPAGSVLTPTVAISDTNADYGKLILGESGLATYILTDTLTGEWTYTITARTGPYPIAFDLYVNPDSPLVAHAFAPEWQPLGAPAAVTTSLFYSATPVSGAGVQADITRPDGSERSISLRDDGLSPDDTSDDGIYSGIFTDTTQGGFYHVLVEANGAYANQAYHRSAQTVFQVAADSATLGGDCADQPKDENKDGLYEYLDVSVGLNAAHQGDFTVAAVLEGEGGQYIDLANATVYSFTGTTTLTLRFDGQAIRASELDGPYTVTEVILLDDAHLIRLEEADNVWMTPPYNHHQFGTWFESIGVTKTANPEGPVDYGDLLSYTVSISATPGTRLGLYDPLTNTSFLRFIEQPTGVTYGGGAITGTLTVTSTNHITVSFVTQVGVPGTAGWAQDVTNQACVFPLGETLGLCTWSNEVTNPAFRPYEIYLPLVMRNT